MSDVNMQLTKSFSLSEMIFSETAERFSLHNYPSAEEISELRNLCVNVLQPLRDALGVPVIVNSGYRGIAVNKKIGGSLTSQHMKGQAADIRVVGMDAQSVCEKIIELGLPFDQLIFEGTWTHVSYNAKGNRKQVLTAHFAPGMKTSYTSGLPKR